MNGIQKGRFYSVQYSYTFCLPLYPYRTSISAMNHYSVAASQFSLQRFCSLLTWHIGRWSFVCKFIPNSQEKTNGFWIIHCSVSGSEFMWICAAQLRENTSEAGLTSKYKDWAKIFIGVETRQWGVCAHSVDVFVLLWRNLYTGTLEVRLQSSNKEPMYGSVCPHYVFAYDHSLKMLLPIFCVYHTLLWL